MTLKWSNNHFYDSSPPELEPSVILHSVGQGQGHWKEMGARHVWWAVPGMVEASRDNSSAYNKLTHQQSTHTHAHTHRDTRFTCCLMTATLCSIGQIYCNNRPVLGIVYNLKLLFLLAIFLIIIYKYILFRTLILNGYKSKFYSINLINIPIYVYLLK